MENGEQIRRSYHNLKQVYAEISYLMRDIEKALVQRQFQPETSHIEYKSSRQFTNHNIWLAPWLSRYFSQPEWEGYLGVSVIFRDHSGKSITPKLLMGIFPETNRAYKKWWISSLYASEEGKFIGDRDPKNIFNIVPEKYVNQWLTIRPKGDLVDERWYTVGHLKVIELTEIENKREIEELVKDLCENDLMENIRS